MKTIAYLFKKILFSGCLLLAACSQNSRFELLDGRHFSENDFNGRWMLINFWAEWCAPCIEEIPELNKLASFENELNLVVIGISYDQMNNARLQSLVDKLNIKYPVMATEPSPILSFDLPQTLPSNYLISPQGKIITIMSGKQTFESVKRFLDIAKTNAQAD